jgi:hypothetical protein
MTNVDIAVYFGLGLVLLVALIFIGRGVTLWYFGISDIQKNQEKMIELLKKIAEKDNSTMG